LRAARKSFSTPRWTSIDPLVNQAPPRLARSGGFTFSCMIDAKDAHAAASCELRVMSKA
jgi:hypothetical protein